MNIRAVGIADSEPLAELHRQCFPKPWDAQVFVELFEAGNALGFVANDTEKQVGFVLLRYAADEAEILTLGVVPSARRRGFAKALIEAGAATACDRGAAKLFLEVDALNAPAVTLYKALGFVKIGRRHSYYQHAANKFEDALVLKASLPLVSIHRKFP